MNVLITNYTFHYCTKLSQSLSPLTITCIILSLSNTSQYSHFLCCLYCSTINQLLFESHKSVIPICITLSLKSSYCHTSPISCKSLSFTCTLFHTCQFVNIVIFIFTTMTNKRVYYPPFLPFQAKNFSATQILPAMLPVIDCSCRPVRLTSPTHYFSDFLSSDFCFSLLAFINFLMFCDIISWLYLSVYDRTLNMYVSYHIVSCRDLFINISIAHVTERKLGYGSCICTARNY